MLGVFEKNHVPVQYTFAQDIEKGMDKNMKRIGLASSKLTPYLFLLPTFLLIVVFRFIPIGYSAWLSVMRFNIVMPENSVFVGFDNFARMAGDEWLWNSLSNTALFTLGSLSIGLFLSLIVALVICEKWFKLSGIARALLFVPFIMSIVISGLIWSFIFQIDFGLLNAILRLFGLPTQQFLGSTSLALWTIIIVAIWRDLGYMITIWSAGILSISKDYIEAARIDGANRFQEILYIKLPLLKPIVVFLLVLGVINSFQTFDLVFVMTAGGPARSTETVIFYLWNMAFRDFNISYAAAIAWLLFAILIVFTSIQIKLFKTEEVN